MLALDVARFGEDSCVLAFCRGPIVERLETWHGLDTVETAEKVVAFGEASYEPTGRNATKSQYARRPLIVVDEPGSAAA